MSARALSLLLLTAPAAAEPAAPWRDAARPAYRAAEALADRFYLLLDHPLSAVLPGRDGRRAALPARSSENDFSGELAAGQERVRRAALEAVPLGQASPARLADWRRRAASAETAALGDAFAATLARRYGLPGLGRGAEEFARDPARWEARRVAAGLLLGGAYSYASGTRARLRAAGARLDLELPPGAALRGSLESGEGSLGQARLSREGSPWSLGARWAMRGGRAARESWSAGYSRRF